MSEILNVINYFWKIGFEERTEGRYTKAYGDGYTISLDMDREVIDFGPLVRVERNELATFTQRNFVVMESIDRLLTKGYAPADIRLGPDASCDILVSGRSGGASFSMTCHIWEDDFDAALDSWVPPARRQLGEPVRDVDAHCLYTSRLKAGIIEPRYCVFVRAGEGAAPSEQPGTYRRYERGLFEASARPYSLSFDGAAEAIAELPSLPGGRRDGDFVMRGSTLVEYRGRAASVSIPQDVRKLANGAFWTCTDVETLSIPDDVVSLGGDTFFGCTHLRELAIPRGVEVIGDNPFADCPRLELTNRSPNFVLEDGALFDLRRQRLIYCAISGTSAEFHVPIGIVSIGKHAFYNCRRLTRIELPETVRILENNPFSNLPELHLVNESPSFVMKDGALYNRAMTTLSYFEHASGVEHLEIPEGVRIVGRHSFYNCQSLAHVVLPATLATIGYNPFANCERLEFSNHSQEFRLDRGVLYDKSGTSLLVCSAAMRDDVFVVPDCVTKLGRSAFAGRRNLRKIVIPRSVQVIDRSAFANCTGLEEVHMHDGLAEVGDWAFYNCRNLRTVDVPPGVRLSRNAFLGCAMAVGFAERPAKLQGGGS